MEYEIDYLGGLSTRCVHKDNKAEILTDAPKDNQGRGLLFSPTDLVAVALGSCVLTLMGIAADRLRVDISGAKVLVTKEMATAPSRRIGKIKIVFSFPQTFSLDVQQKLEKAATGCPVHHSLHPDVVQEFIFEWGVL